MVFNNPIFIKGNPMNFRFVTCSIMLLLTQSFSQINKDTDQLVQVSTIDALLSGIYDGEVSIESLLKQGNFGVGTFNTLDGEMIVADGVCYQIKSDGSVSIPPATLKTPFAAVTHFETDQKFTINETVSLDQLMAKIDSSITAVNMIQAVRIKGRFINATTRSVPSQKPPYRKLTEITKTQPVFPVTNRHGMLVGFRCPPYVKGLNVPGYHLHLLTDDKKEGGHLLSLSADSLTVEIDQTDSFKVLLPHDNVFAKANFTADKEAELKKVEK
jgi:acetolactate decarboxylase